MDPVVTVIVPVHNTLRYLERCFGSVEAQTIGRRKLEVIAVNDGSSDESGDWLDAWARERDNVQVIHQEPSGGAGKPRNVGIERARGTYLFFLDSDDYLGTDALRRMVAMADGEESDIVYGRIVGVGRDAPVDFRTTSAEVDLYDSPVYWTLAPYKLWRRALIEEHGLRFAEGRLLNEDVAFAVPAVLHAKKISVVADHDCYYLEGRGDGTNASRQDVDWVDQLAFVGEILRGLGELVPAGRERDKLMERHFHGEILSMFGEPYLARDEAGRKDMAAAAKVLLDEWTTEPIMAALPPRLRLRVHCLRHGLVDELTEIVRADTGRTLGPAHQDGERVYAAYPYFRDAERAIPDSAYDITSRVRLVQRVDSYAWDGPVLRVEGSARLSELDPAGRGVGVLLRRQGYTYWVPAETADDGTYTLRLDIGRAADGEPLPEGIWTMRIVVTSGELSKEAWLARPSDRLYDVSPEPRVIDRGEAGPCAAGLFHSAAHQHLNLDIGDTRRLLATSARGTVARSRLGRVEATARVTVPGWPAERGEARLLLVSDRKTLTAPTTTEVDDNGRVAARATADGVAPGTWELRLRLVAGSFSRDVPVIESSGEPLRLTVPVPLVRQVRRKAARVVRGR
ncbi:MULTISPECIES: glycosyltransferase family A protein [Streptomyces]|uniref:glycosyltransferase family A protein n=1 Tax=Streptomyces TaxID=1883 RepID=UPI0014209553|nr:glycosyltransferase family A protein [Streptomyces sp. MBT27]